MAILKLAPASTFVAAAGANNNVTPSAPTIATINRLKVDTTAGACNFTGLVAGADGQLLWILNIGANDLTLTNQSAGSTAANRFAGVADITIPANDSAMIYYDSGLTRWVMAI